MPQSIVCLSGNMGSGKTTLGRALAEETGWAFTPEESPAWPFMHELFKNPQRYGLAAQLAFLARKSVVLLRADPRIRTLIDRSIYEDGEVFSHVFHDRGWIQDDAWIAYQFIYDYMTTVVPPPQLIIHCVCDLATCERRVAVRGGPYQHLMPKDQLRHLNSRYAVWLASFDRCPVYEVNTMRLDPRDKDVIVDIAHDVRTAISHTHPGSLRVGSVRRNLAEDEK